MLAGITLADLMEDLHPTPAVAGTPVGEAKMLLRAIEPYNRGLYAGACGFVDGAGDGEFSVALRTGVFRRRDGLCLRRPAASSARAMRTPSTRKLT